MLTLVQKRILVAVILDIVLRLLNRRIYRRGKKGWPFGLGYEPKHSVQKQLEHNTLFDLNNLNEVKTKRE